MTHRTFRALSLIIVLAPLLAAPLDAQRRAPATRTETPEQTAKTMFEQRASASDVAEALRAKRVENDESLRILSEVGFRPSDVAMAGLSTLRMEPEALALSLRKSGMEAGVLASVFADSGVGLRTASGAFRRAGFEAAPVTEGLIQAFRVAPMEAFEALTAVGFPIGEVSRGLEELRIQIDMDCIGPDGFPVPCGNFGKDDNTPAMGQVSISPGSPAPAGSVLVFQSTSIPEVEVLLDGNPLQILEMSPSRVRAVLPDEPTTGPLAFRRLSDAVVGVVVEDFEVVRAEADEYAGLDWDAIAEAARDGAMADMDEWIMRSRFDAASCSVMATSAIGTAGVLQNQAGFSGGVERAIRLKGGPQELADAWQASFEAAFLEWADNVTIPGLPWYPSFAAYPGEEAPPLPNVPTPLVALISSGDLEMSPPYLTQRLNESLPRSDLAEGAIASFANEVGVSFGLFLTSAQVMLVYGRGPVPAFAPPQVPVGPVVAGECFSAGMWTPLLPSGLTIDLPDIG